MGLLHKYFEDRVSLSPDDVALVEGCDDGRSYTYKQLNEQANTLANALIERGVKPGSPIIVSFPGPMSAEQTISMLAILKAGCIYVPMDASSIEGRKKQIITDAKASFVLTSKKHFHNDDFLKDHFTTDQFIDFAHQNTDKTAPDTIIQEDSPAYYIYSSSSKPKGIPVTHEQITGYWPPAFKILFGDSLEDRRIMAFASPGFDASIWEMMLAWSTSAAYVTPGAELIRSNGQQVLEFIAEHNITDALITPTVLSSIEGLEEKLKHLRQQGLRRIYTTGEACTPEIVKACEKAEIQLCNCWGPSEGPIGFTCHEVTSRDIVDGHVSVGKPFTNDVNFHIMTRNNLGELVLASEGEEGELYVESPTLTDGYLNNASLTRDNFPVITVDGGRTIRCFKTGDQFVRRENGDYCYVSPSNIQPTFKQGGERVDYSSIRHVIMACDGVQDVKIIQRESSRLTHNKESKQSRPVALIKLAANSQLTIIELHKYLANELTYVEFPANIVIVDNFSMTDGRKLDKDWAERQAATYYRDSSNPIAQCLTPLQFMLKTIWANYLGIPVDEIGINDSFMVLGGDSVGYMAIIQEAEKLLNLTLPAAELASCSKTLTIERMADFIYQQHAQNNAKTLTKELYRGEGPPIFLLPPVTGDASTSYMAFARKLGEQLKLNNMPATIIALDSPGSVGPQGKQLIYPDGSILEAPVAITSTNLDVIAKSYAKLITERQRQGPYRLYGWSSGGTLAWKVTEILQTLYGADVQVLGLIDSTEPSVKREMSEQQFGREAQMVLETITDKHGLRHCFDRLDKESDRQWHAEVLPNCNEIAHFFNEFMLNASCNEEDYNRDLEIAKAMMIVVTEAELKLIDSPNLHACYATKHSADKLKELEGSLTFLRGNKARGTLGFSRLEENIQFQEFADDDVDHFSILHGSPLERLVHKIVGGLVKMRKVSSPRTLERKEADCSITTIDDLSKDMRKLVASQAEQMKALQAGQKALADLVTGLLMTYGMPNDGPPIPQIAAAMMSYTGSSFNFRRTEANSRRRESGNGSVPQYPASAPVSPKRRSSAPGEASLFRR
ncbi:MAG: hypothetical protein CMF50_10430 [Legionellales bacterium]|nr:hypothetical protein [Legionellales bacterium]|tara:strand:+ start:15510 stop:18713 length:3204 start_codon:yes stop_codon:yes gene_type:complete